MRITPVVFLVFLATAHTLPAAPPTGSPPPPTPTPAAPSPGSPSPSGGVGLSVAATRDLTAQELLDRYDQSMAARRNSRVTCAFRRKAEMSWRAPWRSVSELTVQREEGERIRLTWRRRAPWPAPRDRLAPEDAYVSTSVWDGRNYYACSVTAPSTLAKWKAEAVREPEGELQLIPQ